MNKRKNAIARIKASYCGRHGHLMIRDEFKVLLTQAVDKYAYLTKNRKTSQLYWIASELARRHPVIFRKTPTIGSVRNWLRELKISS